MAGVREVNVDGIRRWIVWDGTDDLGYDHKVAMRDDNGQYLWSYDVGRTESLVQCEINKDVIKVWKTSGYLIYLDIKTGQVQKEVFVK